ncbi:MAG: endo-1,4-beta-xylanase [Patescibacteria group bacterium]
MNFKFKRSLTIFFFLILFLVSVIFCYFFVGKVSEPEKIIWGVNFSQKHAQNLGLDWKETYLALMDDLGTRNLKVAAHWDLLEPEENKFYFDDLDWQINKAKEKEAKVILVIGMKTSRWPECHIPDWAQNLTKEDQQKAVIAMLENLVSRYKDSENISVWQVENEPFFPFGECPWVDKEFLKEEIELVRSLDPRPIMITDSGEGSLWFTAAKMGDIVGTTMYRKVWFTIPSFLTKYVGRFENFGFYLSYPFPSVFYGRKAQIINKLFNKEVICAEFQAEPWGQLLLYNLPLEEQEKTMNLEQFRKNIEYAKKTGLSGFYIWGGEWMYWLKKEQKNSTIWDEAKKLF